MFASSCPRSISFNRGVLTSSIQRHESKFSPAIIFSAGSTAFENDNADNSANENLIRNLVEIRVEI